VPGLDQRGGDVTRQARFVIDNKDAHGLTKRAGAALKGKGGSRLHVSRAEGTSAKSK
jgi:hypothetical protein